MIEVRDNGTLVYEGIAIGDFDPNEKRLVLDAGWMDRAGLKLTVLGDPRKDHKRKLLERPVDQKRLEPKGDQTTIDDELNKDKDPTTP